MGNNSNEKSSDGAGIATWLIGLFVGAVGGATVALLTTPKSGNEVRGAIRQSAKDMPEKVGELVDDSLDIYASALNYTQLMLEEQTMRLKRAVAAGKLAAAKKREELELGGPTVLPFQHK